MIKLESMRASESDHDVICLKRQWLCWCMVFTIKKDIKVIIQISITLNELYWIFFFTVHFFLEVHL